MDTVKAIKIPVLGIILVVVGVGLLLRQLNIITIDAGTVIAAAVTVYGGTMIIRSFSLQIRQSLFFGSLCFFSGIVILLGMYHVIERSPYIYIPAFLLVFGLAFLMLFIFNVKDIHLLVPASVFIGLGIAFMMTEIGYWYLEDVKDAIAMYWPVALILFGGLLLVRRKKG